MGQITITKESDNNGALDKGKSRSGYTAAFGVGLSCRIENPDYWYITSNIKDINWKEGYFDTLNSRYKFTFEEDNDTSKNKEV